MTNDKATEILQSWDGIYIGYSSDEIEEAHEIAISAIKKIKSIERLVNMYAQKGHAPNRTITMEELKRFIS